MRILFVSPDITHHLVPFFMSLCSHYGEENCKFAVTESSDSRQKMGFPTYSERWIFPVHDRSEKEFHVLWMESDVIITRDWSRCDLIETALRNGKIVFYASERWYRPPVGMLRLLFPKYIRLLYRFKNLSKYRRFYYLAMGYYAGMDFARVGLCRNRIFSFGYFTPNSNIDRNPSAHGQIKLIWAGNMLKLKRVIDILKAYRTLSVRYDISLDLIGEGAERKRLEQFVEKYKLENVRFYNFLPNEEIKRRMSESDIFIFPSSGYEGWGAVVNEAMQARCAVVAARETGAARSMIVNGENGMTFQSGNVCALIQVVEKLLKDKKLLETIKERGYRTITEQWSAEEAAGRFCQVVSGISSGQSLNFYDEGPFEIIG